MMRIIAGFLFLGAAMMSGCAASVPTTSVAPPPPDSLRMTILPGADHGEKRIIFQTYINEKGDSSEEKKRTKVSVEEDIDPFEQVDTDTEPAGMHVFSMDDINQAPVVSESVPATNEEEKKGELDSTEFQQTAPVLYQPNTFIAMGYRRDNLDFSISGLDGTPNILSELQWKDLEIIEFTGDFRWSNDSKAYLRGHFGIGWILAGDNQDSDYYGDNRTMEFSRSNNDARGGGVLDGSIGLGYRFSIPLWSEGKIHIMPLGGYSYHEQDVEMTRGKQTVSAYGFSMPLGSFDDLDSRFTAQWRGPWAGIDGELVFNRHHKLMGSFEYHWANYDAEADWNLRSDFEHPISYDQAADGEGMVVALTWLYQSSSSWNIKLGFQYQDWSTDPGEIGFYLSDGTEGTQPLNKVGWDSFSVNFGVGYNF